jgi:hypothetical protein
MVSDRRIFIHFLLTPQAATAGFAILDPLYAFPGLSTGAIATFGLPQH